MRRQSRARKGIEWTRGELGIRWGMIGFVVLLASLALWFSVAEESVHDEIKMGTDLTLPVANLKPGKLLLFTYRLSPSMTTQIAVQRVDDGKFRVAFAACRACSRFHHYESSGNIVCSRCGHPIRLPDLGETPNEKPGCSSVAVMYSIEGEQLVVHAQDIERTFQRWYLP